MELPQNSDSMLQTYFTIFKIVLDKHLILELESTSKEFQNNLPFALEMYPCKRNTTSYRLIDNQGFHLKCICMLTHTEVLQKKEAFQKGGS